MGNPVLRGIGGVIAGCLVGGLITMCIEYVTHMMNPMPAGLDLRDEAAAAQWISSLPPSAFVIVLAAWAAGATVGGWLAGKLGRSPIPAIIVVALLACGGVSNMLTYPHPGWMWAATPIVFLLAGWLAVRLNRGPRVRINQP